MARLTRHFPTSSAAAAVHAVGATSVASEAQTEKAIAAQLHEMEQHGEKLAGAANGFATLLLAVFSAASLLSLSLAAFTKFQAEALAGRLDLPDGLNVLLNLLLVVAMDMAMLYAASVIRAIVNAGGARREMGLHVAVMVTASLLETATYIYLVVQYDRPTNAWLWGIGIGRGIAAPLFATYLSLARKLPVAPRDIAYYVALLSGKGVVRDVAILAGDRTAPLTRKVAIYTAAANMTTADLTKFQNIIGAVTAPAVVVEPPQPTQPGQAGRPTRQPSDKPSDKRQEEPAAPAEEPATEPGAPTTTPATTPTTEPSTPAPLPFPARPPQREPQRQPQREPQRRLPLTPAATTATTPRTERRLPPASARRGLGRLGLPTPTSLPATVSGGVAESGEGVAERAGGGPDEPADRAALDRMALRQRREEAARRILAESPTIVVAELARRIAMATRARISESTARALRDLVLSEQPDEPPAERPALRIIEAHAEPAEPARSVEEAQVEVAAEPAEEQLQQN